MSRKLAQGVCCLKWRRLERQGYIQEVKIRFWLPLSNSLVLFNQLPTSQFSYSQIRHDHDCPAKPTGVAVRRWSRCQTLSQVQPANMTWLWILLIKGSAALRLLNGIWDANSCTASKRRAEFLCIFTSKISPVIPLKASQGRRRPLSNGFSVWLRCRKAISPFHFCMANAPQLGASCLFRLCIHFFKSWQTETSGSPRPQEKSQNTLTSRRTEAKSEASQRFPWLVDLLHVGERWSTVCVYTDVELRGVNNWTDLEFIKAS